MPFIVRWPGTVPAGKKDTTSVITAVDLLPTFLELADVALPEGYQPDGESIVAVPLVLQGTLTAQASSGVATFSDISVPGPVTGAMLRATSMSADMDESDAFNITVPNI